MKRLMLKVAVLAVLIGISLPLVVHADAQSTLKSACTNNPSLAGCAPGSQGLATHGSGGSTSYLQDLVDTFLFAAGIVSLIFVIIGGIRYITSTGDSARIKSAKDTLLYAIIGLIITLLAFPIASYVIKTLGG